MMRVCLSVTYIAIGPKSRKDRPRKTEIGTEVAHVKRDSDTTFKVKRSKFKFQGPGQIVAASRATCCKRCITKFMIMIFNKHIPWPTWCKLNVGTIVQEQRKLDSTPQLSKRWRIFWLKTGEVNTLYLKKRASLCKQYSFDRHEPILITFANIISSLPN